MNKRRNDLYSCMILMCFVPQGPDKLNRKHKIFNISYDKSPTKQDKSQACHELSN